ncbi:hypothetical protein ABMA27_007396 [Loxostege sticticalis]|uniref:Essential protein Yae1 N-terminal domain-containing protein n=2 Tax=Loxostege sticticalis TaxID=481309 RepID=A0ABR3HF90_LOXSC
MNEESSNLSAKSWIRAIKPINKAGYMDGAADGQSAAFQSSFDVGYNQGLIFGLQLGLSGALNSLQNETNNIHGTFNDSRKINCQLCINDITKQEKVDNLYNLQEEENKKLQF